MGFSTDAIHAGQVPDPVTGAIVTPIYQTSTYVQEELGKHKGYEYARTGNPTRTALEKNLAVLERGEYGLAFGSGMAAISAIMNLVKTGEHVVFSENVYGGTFRIFYRVLKDYGLDFTPVDSTDPTNVEKAIGKTTRLVFIETPTNPILTLCDIKAISEITKSKSIPLVVDNTFMSPYFQLPLTLDADIVIHSCTKFLNGHSDVVLGFIATNDEQIYEKLKFIQNAVGGVPGPFDCWLVLRGVKTLAVRMREHDKNGRKIASWLSEHPKVEKVYYPGLPDHPQHELAKRQMSGFGGMISFEMGSLENAKRLMNNVRLFSLAESLGAVESLIDHPAIMTHASVPKEEREKIGITDGLVRISVGIEDVEDLIEDLEKALEVV